VSLIRGLHRRAPKTDVPQDSPGEPQPLDTTQAGDPAPQKFDFVATYESHTEELLNSQGDRGRALELAIGGDSPENFSAIGAMQKDLLVSYGLEPESSLVDVGCGSGRLAIQLRDWLKGSYLGIDVVQLLLDHAATIAHGPHMAYQRVTGLSIPVEDNSIDMVCAFSVFTHLLHEESYAYMADVRRVLKPGGKLVFSFLEFSVPSHWNVMVGNLESLGQEKVLNQFMSEDAVTVWAEHLDFEVMGPFRGDEPYIPLSRPVVLNEVEYRDKGTFGQSAAVFRKPD
jgi:SAM-dependent methyltransferase